MTKKSLPTIHTLMIVFDDLEACLVAEPVDFHRIGQLLRLEGYDEVLAGFAGHTTRLSFLRTAAEKWEKTSARIYRSKSINHLAALRKNVRVFSRDFPFKVRDRVWVERHEHGWNVGPGTVIYRSPGSNPSYTVRMDIDYGGYEIHIDRTRDLRPAR